MIFLLSSPFLILFSYSSTEINLLSSYTPSGIENGLYYKCITSIEYDLPVSLHISSKLAMDHTKRKYLFRYSFWKF